MSKILIGSKVSVRCGKHTPTPYLRANCHNMLAPGMIINNAVVVDLGCGNGRNSRYLCNTLGVPRNLYALDIHTDYGDKCDIGSDYLPIRDGEANIILANYVLMFLKESELRHVLAETTRISARYCRLMIEMYWAKSSYTPDKKSAYARHNRVVRSLIAYGAWYPIHWVRDKAILSRRY